MIHPIDKLDKLTRRHRRESVSLQRELDAKLVTDYRNKIVFAELATGESSGISLAAIDKDYVWRADKAFAEEITVPFRERATEMIARQRDETDECERELRRIAANYSFTRTDEWSLVRIVYSSNYSSQGFGAISYARSEANMLAMDYRSSGVEIDVVAVNHHRAGRGHMSVSYCDFEIRARVSPSDARLLEYAPKCDLVEFVRRCWAQGSNPRVYLPGGLDYDFESRHGLDYFGGRKDATVSV